MSEKSVKINGGRYVLIFFLRQFKLKKLEKLSIVAYESLINKKFCRTRSSKHKIIRHFLMIMHCVII